MSLNYDAFGLPIYDYGHRRRATEKPRTNAQQLRYLAGLVGQPGNFWDPSVQHRMNEMADELEQQEKAGDDWLQIGDAKKNLADIAAEIDSLIGWLGDTKKRFKDFSDKELKKPDGELSALQRRHDDLKSMHTQEVLELTKRIEALNKQIKAMRMGKEEKVAEVARLTRELERASRSRANAVGQARSQAERADAAEKKVEALQTDLTALSEAVVRKLIPHQTARTAPANNEAFALQAAISMEHAAVPNHGRLTGRSDCWDGCGCDTKPKVCRVCRTYTGGLVISPCRTVQIAQGD